MDLMQRLHDSEINASISWFYDGCWTWKLGDEMNGFVAENTELTLPAALSALEAAALSQYPDSVFAKSRAHA